MSGTINVARWLPRSRANGPGERFVLWVQGCGLACKGCWNPDTWSFAPRRLVTPEDLLAEVDHIGNIEGITLTGGEPFNQAASLVPFVEGVRERGLSVVIFTGFAQEELRSPSAQRLLTLADVLVAGRYDHTQPATGLPLVGSRNQVVRLPTDRYSESDINRTASCEAHIENDGSVRWTGFPEELLLKMNA